MNALAAPVDAVGYPTRKRIAPFVLHRPASIEAALEIYRAHGRTAFFAGGMDALNRMKSGARVDHLVHLGAIPALRAIMRGEGQLRLGSGVTHREAADAVRSSLPGLAALLDRIANIRVRCAGTLGGNVMALDPGYEILPAMAALGARLVFADAGGERFVPAAEFVPDDALLTGFELPLQPGTCFLFDRAHRPVASVLAGILVRDGALAGIRIAFSCVYDRPYCYERAFASRLPVGEAAGWAAEVAAEVTAALPEPLSDWIASGRYRRRLIGVIVRRLLERVGSNE